MKEAFGGLSSDWKEGINWAASCAARLRRAREAMPGTAWGPCS